MARTNQKFPSSGRTMESRTEHSYMAERTHQHDDRTPSHAVQGASPPSLINSRNAAVLQQDGGGSSTGVKGGSLFKKVDTTSPNIVIFGSTGTGKSSIINMLAEKDVAATSNKAVGCTFGNTDYPVTIDGVEYKFWDTSGLNEGEEGSVPAEQAWQNLRELVDGLKDGVSLLVYCIRGGRYRDIIKVNYDLFARIICQNTVPIVVIVTGLENEDHMEDWWTENEREFTRRNVHFAGHACITSSKGKVLKDGSYAFEEEFEESKVALRKLIGDYCPAHSAWAIDSQLWLSQIMDSMQRYYDDFNRRVETNPNAFQSPSPSAVMGGRERRVSEPDTDVGERSALANLFFGFLGLVFRR